MPTFDTPRAHLRLSRHRHGEHRNNRERTRRHRRGGPARRSGQEGRRGRRRAGPGQLQRRELDGEGAEELAASTWFGVAPGRSTSRSSCLRGPGCGARPALAAGVGPTGRSVLRATGPLVSALSRSGPATSSFSQAGPLQLRTGAGNITVERAVGRSEITTGSGAVHVSRTEGASVIKSSNGDIWVGEANGRPARDNGQRQDQVALARSDVEAKTANGSVADRRGHERQRARPDGGGQSRSGRTTRRGGVTRP